MTGYGMCGVFILDRVLAGQWRIQWKASDRMWAGRCTAGCGRGQVYTSPISTTCAHALIYLSPSTTCAHAFIYLAHFHNLCTRTYVPPPFPQPVHTHLYTCPLPQPAVHLPAPIRSLAFHWLLQQPARTLSGINTPHIPCPVIIHPPAYEDGTDTVF